MGIAFSERLIKGQHIEADGAEEFIENLDLLLRAVNWTPIEALEDGGYKYQLESRQELTCRCIVQPDPANPSSVVIVQFLSDDELVEGRIHRLQMGTGRVLFAIAGHCQLFISLPDYSNDADSYGYGHSVAGGIPYVDPAELGEEVSESCAVTGNSDITTELWWSCGDGGALGSGNDNFRFSLVCSPSAFSGVRNGVACHPPLIGAGDALRIFPLRHPTAISNPWGQYTAWVDDSPIWIDPLIGWSNRDGQARVRGQLWDAMLASRDMPLDDEIYTTEADVASTTGRGLWRNYTHYKGVDTPIPTDAEPYSYNGSLYLLYRLTQDGIESNYCY